MESNWRQNVANTGLVGTRFLTLAARMVETFMGQPLYLGNDGFAPFYNIYLVVPGQVPVLLAQGTRESPHFPYGVPVFPD